MIFFKNKKTTFNLLNIFIIFCMALNLFSGYAFAGAEPGRGQSDGKVIIPSGISSKIFEKGDKLLKDVCGRLSKIPGWDIKVSCGLIDAQNRIFWAVEGKFGHKWPFKDIDKDHVLKVETDGNIAIDFFLNEASTQNDFVTYEFNADIIIRLDDMICSLAKFAAGMAASAAIDFAANNLIALLENIDSKLLSDALAKTCSEFSKALFNKSFGELAENLKDFEEKGGIHKAIVEGIKNGNIFSFLVFNIINVGAHQGANLAGAALGSVIGTALFPGAGTIIGGLAAKASSLLITKFVINKIGSEWLLKLEIAKYIKVSRKLKETQGADLSLNEEYKKRFDNISGKLKDDLGTSEYKKFNTLMSILKSDDTREIIYLKPIISDLKLFMESKILNGDDWVTSRKYYQLKQVISARGLEKQFGY